jgi:hypothetical protein
MKKIYKILNIIFVFEVLFFLFFVSDAVYNYGILQDIRAEKDFKFLLVSTDEQNLLGGYVLDYSIAKQAILVFPINGKTRYMKNNAEKPVYLQDVYQRIYYRNKRNLNGSMKQLLGTINQIYDLDVKYFIHFSSADIVSVNNLYAIDSISLAVSALNLDYSKIISSDSDDRAILEKYFIVQKFLSIFNIFEIFRVTGILEKIKFQHIQDIKKINSYNFAEKKFRELDTNIKNSNISLKELFCLVMSFYKIEKLKFVFVGFNNVLYDDDVFYIRDTINNTNKITKEIVVEVLNGSGRKGLALDVTRFLRDNNFDVQQWGNYGAVNDTTMIIDRKGFWENAQSVSTVFKKGVILSKQDKNSFSDVSVILGRDLKNFN